MDSAEVFKREHQRMSSTKAMPQVHDSVVKLVHQCEAGEYEFHAFRFFQCDAHIFDEVLDKKSGLEVSLKNTRREVVQGPAGCGSATDGVQHSV